MAITVVQAAVPAGVSATAATVTFPGPVTAGNTICASVAVFDGRSSSFTLAFELGSSPDNWALCRHATRTAGGGTNYAGCWADIECAGGETAVTVTLSGATGGLFTGIILAAWEVAGLADGTIDITGGGTANSASWSTGAWTPSAASSAPAEFWWGVVSLATAPATITGPSGWANTAAIAAGSSGASGMAGYQVASATGSPVYDGTTSSGGQVWAAAGAALMPGSASGSAAMSGGGTLSAEGGPAAAAGQSGSGTLTAAATAGTPDSSFPSGAGQVSVTPMVTVEAGAAMSGTGQASGVPVTGQPQVVNQWAGSIAQNPAFGPSLPSAPSVNVPLTPAASVGGGSGVPTAGNWLFCIAGWRQVPSLSQTTINVADDTHAWWRPSPPSPPGGNTRAAIWYTPNIGQITNNPAMVYVAPNGYIAGMSVLVIEVSGIGAWDEIAGLAANYAASTESLTLTVTL